MVYLVTGATGNIGSRVVDRLLAPGERPRVFARDPEKARARFDSRVDVAVGDLAESASLARALSGVDALFLVNSGSGLEVRDEAAAKVAKASGVKRLVKLSSADAAQQVGTGVWHAQGEAAIRATGIAYTFVRPTGFMDNALYWARSIKASGVVRSSTGEGKIPFIHSDDIADVAAKVLTTAEHEGEVLPITGPEALSYAEMTAKIGAGIGRTLTYQAISDEEARQQQIAWGTEPAMVEARLSIFRAIREGRLAGMTDNVERVLGRHPANFDRWIEQNGGAFR
jgi:(4-alkanoyl-5-oxo-2,5-dihydrofuran-3-yl)methyl phosphate reductase